MVKQLSGDAFLDDLLFAYRSNVDRHGRLWPIPIIAGAGTSVTSGVPTSAKLIDEIARDLNGASDKGFQGIYEAIAERHGVYAAVASPHAEDRYASLQHKIELRRQLYNAGIPRGIDRPAANLSNLAILHLLRSRMLAPVIALNVDPLLSVAAEAEQEDSQLPLRFIANASQFSDLGRSGLEPSQLVLQVHGSIEEPLSLRFLDAELCDREAAIFTALVRETGNSRSIFCIGSSLSDEVVPRFLEDWMSRNKDEAVLFRFFVAMRGAAPKQLLDNLEARVRTGLPSGGARFEIVSTFGADSDKLLLDLVNRANELSRAQRGEDKTDYYIPKMTRAVLRHSLESVVSKGSRAYAQRPELGKALQIEAILHAAQARGPFTVTDLVRCSNLFRQLRPEGSHENKMTDVRWLRRLVEKRVLAFANDDGGRQNDSVEPPSADGIERIRRLRFVRHADANDPHVFARRCLEALGFHGAERAWAERENAVAELMIELERERAIEFIPTQAIPLVTYFEDAAPITTHRDMDRRLDGIKHRFETATGYAVRHDETLRCHVVTEVGEHLFVPEKLQEIAVLDLTAPFDDIVDTVSGYLRPWLEPVYRANSPEQTIDLYLAHSPAERLFAGPADKTRSGLEKNVEILIKGLLKSRSIRVHYIQRERHTEHMWYYHTGDQPSARGEGAGIYFPTHYDEQSYCAVEIHRFEDLVKLSHIRETMRTRYERFPASPPANASRVLAVTIIDNSAGLDAQNRLEDARMLVCVRAPETNEDHGNVASVPTKRLPRVLFDEIFRQGVWNGAISRADTIFSMSDFVRDRGTFASSNAKTGDDVLCDAVNDLLARKFNLGDALERKQIRFRTKPLIVRTGESPKVSDQDADEREMISILNAVVLLDAGAELFPKSSQSYSHMQWVPVSEFRNALGSGDAEFEFEGGTRFKYGGLCICSADLLLTLIENTAPAVPEPVDA